MPKNLVTLKRAADHRQCSESTIRNYIKRGYFPAYRVPGKRGLRVVLAEVDSGLSALPRAKAHAGIDSWGPTAHIVTISTASSTTKTESQSGDVR